MALAGAPATGSYLKQPTRASGLLQPVEQDLEVGFRLLGEADDEGGADGEVGADLAPAREPCRIFSLCAGRRMAFQHRGEACWKGMSR
jgi:hypothetical protein